MAEKEETMKKIGVKISGTDIKDDKGKSIDKATGYKIWWSEGMPAPMCVVTYEDTTKESGTLPDAKYHGEAVVSKEKKEK